ncbi:MAG: glycoside hydrolase family 3 C-terminal domain-containing protein [Bacteroides sp.]|nr:glycoside hydrolase family 3 C-terminal domain-containing protein [Bacteroides sp.]
MNTKKLLAALLAGCLCACTTDTTFKKVTLDKSVEERVDSLMKLMTLEEKIGQLNQYAGDIVTGPETRDTTKMEQIKQGMIGSMLNVIGVKSTREVQELALQSPHKIPMLFGLDVIHGQRTIYPIPLGEAASFDFDLMRRTAEGAAREAAAEGIHWTFAPMVDVTRDARWGRVMEGAGEDTWYGTQVALARVDGFQGDDLADPNTLMACAKHFAAYGACIAGKDYNSVEISRLTLHDTYLPPFKAIAEAGVGSFMNSFNDVDGIPATGNEYLQRILLKGEWDFNGLVVSDWGSIGEMIGHRYAADLKDAGKKSILAGNDMDMESRAYIRHLKELVEEGAVPEAYVDDACRRVLQAKFRLGLFDDPFRYCDEEREKNTVLCDELRQLSREAGMKSVVLLKNDNQALPLAKSAKSIALIGTLADSKVDMRGFWAGQGVVSQMVTVREGLQNKYPDARINYANGYDLRSNELQLTDALSAARRSDVVVVAVGERADWSGEAKSRADITIPATHQQLVKELKKTGKKVIVLLMGGRPMIFNDMEPYADAILLTWWLGTEAGNAIADVLAGDYNPSGKLPMTFPAHIGQIPIYYNYKSTGRPESKRRGYTCSYQDIDFEPAYPFGYGLSYTTFDISEPRLSKEAYAMGEPVEVTVTVKNTGKYAGKETVQLYIKDVVASVTRPVKELRAFRQVELQPNEEADVTFTLSAEDLGFYNKDIRFITEPGEFVVMVGSNSKEVKNAKFVLN